MFTYEGLSAVDNFSTTSSHSGYYHFLVKEKNTGNVVLDFYTNGYFEGMFHYDEIQCIYRQTRGTCQFSLPRSSKRSLRDALRKMALRKLNDL